MPSISAPAVIPSQFNFTAIGNPKPIIIKVTTTAPEFINNTAATGGAQSGGIVDRLGGIFNAILPYAPFIIGAAVFVVLIFFLFKFLFTKNKQFQKDYDKEAYKRKTDYLNTQKPRTHSTSFLFCSLIVLIGLFLASVIQFALYLFKLTDEFNFWITGGVAVACLVISFLITRIFITAFVSYPRATNSRGELVGYMLSNPVKTPEGYLDILIFKGVKWLFWKNEKILSIPLNQKYDYTVSEKSSGIKKKKSVTIPAKITRWFMLSDGNIKVNAEFFHQTRFFVYPIYSDNTGDIYDIREMVFIREKGIGDNLNLIDLANETRENAIILVGGNPTLRLNEGGEQKRNENE